MPLSVGEIAYTSGISEIYPPNIPVAKVISIDKRDDQPFQHVVVELLASIDSFDFVFVVL
jgi:rod shape-determining protein MreC